MTWMRMRNMYMHCNMKSKVGRTLPIMIFWNPESLAKEAATPVTTTNVIKKLARLNHARSRDITLYITCTFYNAVCTTIWWVLYMVSRWKTEYEVLADHLLRRSTNSSRPLGASIRAFTALTKPKCHFELSFITSSK